MRWFDTVAASSGCTISYMVTLARFRVGRILLHLLAMAGDRCVRFHVAGIIRELPWIAAALTLLTRTRTRLIGALLLYLVKHNEVDICDIPIARVAAAQAAIAPQDEPDSG